MSEISSESIIDCGVWDGWGNPLGDVKHPPMVGEELKAYPLQYLLGPAKSLPPGQPVTADLIVRAAYDGGISGDALAEAVAVMDRRGIILVLAWSLDALNETTDAVMRMSGGGRA